MTIDLAFASATELAALVRDGQVSSRELVALYLDRIARYDGQLNAVVTLDPEGALKAAGERDREVAARADLGPLHGVPMTVKDAFAVAGMRSTSGSNDRAEDVPAHDAVAVRRLREAGAVLLGKTNCPAGVTGQETANELFGRTCNPWDLARTPGGSSGGAAAALAAGLTPLELGSDSGGSIRQPAHCCGVYGHAATHGLVPLGGHRPSVELDQPGKDVDLLTLGPMARHPDDLELALEVLGGPDPVVGSGWGLKLPPAAVTDVRSLRVAVWTDDPACPVSTAVRSALEEAADALAEAGATVDRTSRPFELRQVEDVAFALWVAASSERTSEEEMERLAKVAADPGAPQLVRRRAAAETMSHRDWLRLDSRRRRLQARWTDLFEHVHVLLCPVSPVPALPHDPDPGAVASVDHRLELAIDVDGRQRPYLDQIMWPITVGMNGSPATVAPVGRTAEGLPLGVQIVGPPGGDRTCIAVARMLREVVPKPGRPPGFA